MTAPAVRGRFVCSLCRAIGNLVTPQVTEPGTHPKLPERDREPHRGKAHQQLREHRLQFDPGERGAEALAGRVRLPAGPGPPRRDRPCSVESTSLHQASLSSAAETGGHSVSNPIERQSSRQMRAFSMRSATHSYTAVGLRDDR